MLFAISSAASRNTEDSVILLYSLWHDQRPCLLVQCWTHISVPLWAAEGPISRWFVTHCLTWRHLGDHVDHHYSYTPAGQFQFTVPSQTSISDVQQNWPPSSSSRRIMQFYNQYELLYRWLWPLTFDITAFLRYFLHITTVFTGVGHKISLKTWVRPNPTKIILHHDCSHQNILPGDTRFTPAVYTGLQQVCCHWSAPRAPAKEGVPPLETGDRRHVSPPLRLQVFVFQSSCLMLQPSLHKRLCSLRQSEVIQS